MRHLHVGRKLGVGPDRRTALLRSLTIALIEKEAIRTTPARAKEIRWWAERIVTLAKRGDLGARRQIVKLLGSTETNIPGKNRVQTAVSKVYSTLVPRFKTRPGGYTQIVRLADRRPGDNAEMCLMRYIPAVEDTAKGKGAKSKKKASDKGVEMKADGAKKRSDKPAKTSSKKKEEDKE